MIPMPYIVVIIVLDMLSIPFFSLTSTALLFRLPLTRRYWPEGLSKRTWAPFVVLAVLMAALALAVRLLVGRAVFPVFAWVGFGNSLVLVYGFLGKRCFLRRPQLLRRLLIGLLSIIITGAAVIAVEAAVIVLFVIR